jgi:hypothetical protein
MTACCVCLSQEIFAISIWLNVFKTHTKVGRYIGSCATFFPTAKIPYFARPIFVQKVSTFRLHDLEQRHAYCGLHVRAARRRVNKLRRKIWSRWYVQRKAGAENYSRFGVVEFTAFICIHQEY